MLRSSAIKLFNFVFHDDLVERGVVGEAKNHVSINKFPVKFEDAIQIHDTFCSAEM